MKSKRICYCLLFCTITVWLAGPAFSVTLKVNSVRGAVDRSLVVPIVVDNPASIAGATFALDYSSSLSVSVDSTFFDIFYNQFDPLDTTGEAVMEEAGWKFTLLDENGNTVYDSGGNPVYVPDRTEVDGVVYTQAVLDNVTTQSAAISHYIAGARPTPATAGEDPTLFNLRVSLKAGHPPGKYPIRIVPATVNNADAGYNPAGETVDLLVGSDAGRTFFPVILDDRNYADSVVNGAVEFRTDMEEDEPQVDFVDEPAEPDSGGGSGGGSCFIDAISWQGQPAGLHFPR